MILISILRYFAGSIKLVIWDGFIERFLNLASRNGISFWKVKIRKDGALEVWMKASLFKELRPIVRKTGVKVHILEKRGFPFKAHKYRKRVGLIIGLIAFTCIMFILSNVIWVIKVEGNKTVSEDAIIQELSKCGFKTGIFKWDTDLDTVHQSVLLEMPKLSWIAINIKGSTATVEVRERLDKPDIVKAGDPCNIVALYDGQIIEMNVFQGKAAVKVGETVKKGQLLISGVLDSKTQGTRFVEAKGEVKAHLWREITKIQPLKIAKTEMTGEICTKKVLHLGDAAINLFTDSSIPFEKYGIIKKTKPIIDASPFKSYLETIEYHELKTVEESITSEKAEQLARESANAEINKLSAYEILAQNYEVKKTNDSVIVTVNIEYTAAIGKSVPLDIQK